MSCSFSSKEFIVNSPNVTYTEDQITANYHTSTPVVDIDNGSISLETQQFTFRTDLRVPKVGVMLVGWGGNNGSTLTAGILANKLDITWHTKEGPRSADYLGSLTQASTVPLGTSSTGAAVHIPFKKMLPMVEPNDLVLGGWDISSANLADAMKRSQVLDYDLQRQLQPHMTSLEPLPSIYYPDFIAANQEDRADNVLPGHDKLQHLETIRQNIRDFKQRTAVDKVIVLWTANTERFCSVEEGLNDSAEALMASIKNSAAEVSPSTIFAVASILENCSYINGSPQNTCVPGVIELAEQHKVFLAGDDFKSGQTKIKSVLVDYLVSAGIKPVSIVSYNHLGNNDGRNLSAPEQFRSKEISKSNVVDDMVESNRILYKDGEHPDHTIVIKYVPYVGDSKRAMDEYTSEIFMGGRNTIAMHNTCEDSLLATPLIIDLIVLCEVCERISVQRHSHSHLDTDEESASTEKFHSVLSLLSYLLKAPLVPDGTPVVNALGAQRQCIVNTFRACIGLPPIDYMHLEHKIPSMIKRGT
mmetsp:Transcript_29077/g.49070  ORF Transcript_29077/g.49070 Transcript_29077/m.49070 type:complete len:529 (+) Transcript_29077:60-1646(+)